MNETITQWQTFPDDLSKSEQHDITQPKLSAYPWRFYGDDKTLKRRFQTCFYYEYPWIEYSIKEDAPACFCCELPFLRKRLLTLTLHFFSCLKRLKKLAYLRSRPTMSHERLSSFALTSIERDLSHPDSVEIEHFIENFKLYSNK